MTRFSSVHDRRRRQAGAVGVHWYRRVGDLAPFPLEHDNDRFCASADLSSDLLRTVASDVALAWKDLDEAYGFILDLQVAAGIRRDLGRQALLGGLGHAARDYF